MPLGAVYVAYGPCSKDARLWHSAHWFAASSGPVCAILGRSEAASRSARGS